MEFSALLAESSLSVDLALFDWPAPFVPGSRHGAVASGGQRLLWIEARQKNGLSA
jgi:hypothetical protein